MMTAPLPSRSHFEGELRYDSVDHVDPKESDMDGSTPRVSSASTETTAASTLASTVTPPTTTATTSSNTHMPTPSEENGSALAAAEEEETTLVSPSAEAALSGTTTITSCLGEEEEEDPMLVKTKEKKDRLNMDSNRVSTMSLPDFSSAGLPEFNDTPPLQIQSVARMPSISSDQAEEIEQMMDLVQKLEEEEQKKKKSSTLNDQEDCKKPAATAARSKKNNASVSFADLPPIQSTPDNLNSEELDQKPAAKPTATAIPTSPIATNNNNGLGNGRTGRPTALTDRQRSKSDASNNSTSGNIPTPRGRGLRGRRRQPQTAQDRETRRKQILENCSRSRSPVPPSSGSQASSLQSSQASLQSMSPMMNGPKATAAIGHGAMEPTTITSSLIISPLGAPKGTISSLPTSNAAATAMEPSVALTTPRSGAAAAAASAAAIVMEPTIPVTTPRTGAATASALASMEPSIVPVARRPRSQSPTATATTALEPPNPVAAKAPPRSRSPTPTRTPRSPTRSNNNNMNNQRNTTTPMPGDSLFGSRNRPPNAPGDNLSTRSPIRTRARTIRPLFSTAAQQQGQHGGSNNPAASGIRNNAPRPPAVGGGSVSATASATNENGMNNSGSNDDSDHSAKQRARRQNDDTSNLPSNIRPGAYKEIPGRGLIRNNTLRFSIMTSIANQKRSFRRMFSSSRRNSISGSDNFRQQRDLNASTNTNMSADNSTLGISNQTDGNRNRRIVALASASSLRGGGALQREASTRSVKSIQSVLVDDSERSNDRSYLGNISFRSLTQAKKGGLCVARPVYQREASMLEALCIIPGDLAVAEALDVQLNGEIQNNAAERLVALRSDNSASNINNNTSTTSASSVAVATATTKPAPKKKPPPPPPPPPPSEPPLTPGGSIRKRAKAKKVVETVVGTPIRLLKATPKALKASQRGLGGFVKNKVIGKLKHSHERRRSARMHAGSLDSGKKTKSAARLKVVKEDDPNNNHNNNATGEASTPAVRRHSF